MVQAKQARFATRLAAPSERRTLVIASGPRLPVPSNCTSWLLRVGKLPKAWVTSIIESVPVRARSARVWLARSAAFASPVALAKAASSSTVTPRVPRTAMALRFLDPITAPTPERPAARSRSFMTQA